MFLGAAVLMIFAALVGVWGFNAPNANGANIQSEAYANNMVIWHQAAMLQVANDATVPNNLPCTQNSSTYCTQPINDRIYDATKPSPAKGAMATYWPDYQSLLPQTAGSLRGWQSWITKASDSNDFYLITFLPPQKPLQAGNFTAVGSISQVDINLPADVRAILQDQTGVGRLKCADVTGSTCNKYYIDYTDVQIDLARSQSTIIQPQVINAIAATITAPDGTHPNMVGATVIMTHIQTPK